MKLEKEHIRHMPVTSTKVETEMARMYPQNGTTEVPRNNLHAHTNRQMHGKEWISHYCVKMP